MSLLQIESQTQTVSDASRKVSHLDNLSEFLEKKEIELSFSGLKRVLQEELDDSARMFSKQWDAMQR